MKYENIDENTDSAAHTSEGVADFDSNDIVISQDNDRSAIVTFDPFSLEIFESDSTAT